MIEWLHKSDYHDDNFHLEHEKEILQVGDKLWYIYLMNEHDWEMVIAYFDNDQKTWISLNINEREIPSEIFDTLSDWLFSSDDRCIYISSIHGNSLSIWKFDTYDHQWSRLMEYGDVSRIVQFFVHNNKVYGIFEEESLTLDSYDLETKEHETLLEFDYDFWYSQFFKFNGQLYLFVYTNDDKTLIYLIDNSILQIISTEQPNEVFERSISIYTSGQCLNCCYLVKSSDGIWENKMTSFNFDTLKWSKCEIKQIANRKNIIRMFDINKRMYAVYMKNNVFGLNTYIGVEVDKLETRVLLQIAEDYKRRMKNGEKMAELVEDIERLVLPEKLKNNIREVTIWRMKLKRRKMRREKRRKELEIVNDPLSEKPEEKEETDYDEVEFDIPTDNTDKDDNKLYWRYNYPMTAANQIHLVNSVRVGDKIWLFNTTRKQPNPVQVYNFDTQTDKWIRVYYQHEELFIGKTDEEKKRIGEKYGIPINAYSHTSASCAGKIYVLKDHERKNSRLYELDTESMQWNRYHINLHQSNDYYGSDILGTTDKLIVITYEKDSMFFQYWNIDTKHVEESFSMPRKTADERCMVTVVDQRIFIIIIGKDERKRKTYELVDKEMTLIRTTGIGFDDEDNENFRYRVSSFSNGTSIYQMVTFENCQRRTGMYLDCLDTRTMIWSRREIEDTRIGKDWEGNMFAIGDCLYRQYYTTYRCGVHKLELDTSPTTLYLTKLADEILKNEESGIEINMSRNMKKKLMNILEFNKLMKKWKRLKMYHMQDDDSEIEDIHEETYFDVVDQLDVD